MRIKLEDLDSSIKTQIRDILIAAALQEYRTLPVTTDTDAIKNVVEKAMSKCVKAIQDYYRAFCEHDVECAISTEDYIRIYRREI